MEIVAEEVLAPPPLPFLDTFAPCETLGEVAPAPVAAVVEALLPTPPPVAKEPIPTFAGLRFLGEKGVQEFNYFDTLGVGFVGLSVIN